MELTISVMHTVTETLLSFACTNNLRKRNLGYCPQIKLRAIGNAEYGVDCTI